MFRFFAMFSGNESWRKPRQSKQLVKISGGAVKPVKRHQAGRGPGCRCRRCRLDAGCSAVPCDVGQRQHLGQAGRGAALLQLQHVLLHWLGRVLSANTASGHSPPPPAQSRSNSQPVTTTVTLTQGCGHSHGHIHRTMWSQPGG